MMAKSTIVLAAALCFLLFLGSAYGGDRFFVEGVVYCGTCRAQFITRITEFIEGATARMECKELEGGDNVTFSQGTKTGPSGMYRFEVDGDHEDEICEVVLVKSGRDDCAEINHADHLYQAARVSITANNGIVLPVRNASPLGFLAKTLKSECPGVLNELGVRASSILP